MESAPISWSTPPCRRVRRTKCCRFFGGAFSDWLVDIAVFDLAISSVEGTDKIGVFPSSVFSRSRWRLCSRTSLSRQRSEALSSTGFVTDSLGGGRPPHRTEVHSQSLKHAVKMCTFVSSRDHEFSIGAFVVFLMCGVGTWALRRGTFVS